MKTSNVLTKLLLGVAFAVSVTACTKESALPGNETTAPGLKSAELLSETCAPQSYTLFGGQTINMGILNVWNDAENLYVEYDLTDPYLLNEVQLWLGTDPELVPMANGNPIPGQFPYKSGNISTSSYTFTVPLADVVVNSSDFCGKQLYIYAHASANGETLWSEGTPFTGNRWGWYSSYTVCCSETPPPPVYQSETAFAKFTKGDGGHVFTTGKQSNPENYPTLGLTNNRWGWAASLSTSATYTSDVWAGAGLNKTSNGVKAGTLQVSASGGNVTVTYTLLPGFSMSDVHLYAGVAKPTTLAPGQYGNTVHFDPKVNSYSETFPIAGYSGQAKFWIIAHSVVSVPQ